MRLSITHETVYQYAEPAFDSHNEVRLRPLDDDLQQTLRFDLSTEPRAAVRTRSDYFGNTVHYFSVPGYHRSLRIRAESLVMTQQPAILGPQRERPLPLSASPQSLQQSGLAEFLSPSSYVPRSDELQELGRCLVRASDGDAARFWDALLGYMHENLSYVPGATGVEDDALKVLHDRRGVCQDFAHLVLGLSRAAGVPARYVSGYVKPVEGGADASHAWAELHLPALGWVGMDASARGPIDERYVRVAYGRDYADANPVRGTFKGGGQQQLQVGVRVQHPQQ